MTLSDVTMFEPTQACPTTIGSSDASTCCGQGMVNEQASSFAAADLSIVELTEIEYTHLQQLLYSHIDSQRNEGNVKTNLSTPFYPSSTLCSAPHDESTSLTTSRSQVQSECPLVCQSAVPTDNGIVHVGQTLGHVDFQELRMMVLGDYSLPPSSADGHPSNTTGDFSRAGSVWVRPNGLNKENENLCDISEARTKSTVRVRLEDRFNSLQTDVPRCTEMAEASVTENNLMTNIHHPQLKGSQQPDKCSLLIKNNAAPCSLQLVRSGTNRQSTTPTGNADSVFAQTSSSLNCGASCPLLEAAKNQEISLSQGFSFCYQQEIKSAKQNLVPRKKSFSEEVLVKVEDTLCKQSIKKRSRSHIRHSFIDMERRVLSDIKNSCQGAPKPPDPTCDSKQTGLSQRRERHNRMERDRRHRIRVCCDELNSLVPFCTMETDKATTLQWTTAFLKYIQERQGDTLKKEFETVFCGSAGRRLRFAKSEGPRTDLEEAAGSSSHPNVK